jgi:hypothetical protein
MGAAYVEPQPLSVDACSKKASVGAKGLAKIELPTNFSNTTSTCRRSRKLSLHRTPIPKLTRASQNRPYTERGHSRA